MLPWQINLANLLRWTAHSNIMTMSDELVNTEARLTARFDFTSAEAKLNAFWRVRLGGRLRSQHLSDPGPAGSRFRLLPCAWCFDPSVPIGQRVKCRSEINLGPVWGFELIRQSAPPSGADMCLRWWLQQAANMLFSFLSSFLSICLVLRFFRQLDRIACRPGRDEITCTSSS